jgi:hypothetical protein
MLIENQTPVVIPAIEEKTFPHVWIRNISIVSNSKTHGVLQLALSPYNGETQEVHDSILKTIRVDDLWKAINEVPELGLAFTKVLEAVAPLENWIQNQVSAE